MEKHTTSLIEPKITGDPPRQRSKAVWVWLLILFAIGAASFVYWKKSTARTVSAREERRKGGADARQDSDITAVMATRVRRGDIGVYFNGLGNVTPIYTVTVRSRVDGQLMDVRYNEGDTVKQGDLLMQIDPRPFEVQRAQAEAQLAKDQAALQNARTDLSRYEELLKQNAIAEQLVTTQKSTVAQDESAVAADRAQIDSAELNLTYSKITAPITGRMGLRLVDPGNIVHASDTNGLVVITQIKPISVLFTIAEDQLQVVLKKLRAGEKLPVDAYDREMTTKIASGMLTTVDNQIDPTTGTVRLRATFDNNDEALFPNQFVNARLLVEEKRGVVLVPSAAIQRTSTSAVAYVVQPDSTVTVRPVTIGTEEGGVSEVTSGLKPRDTVVLTGTDKLQEGSKVNAQLSNDNGSQTGASGLNTTNNSSKKAKAAVQGQ
jgi:membrane fusion protein, multidrug efflux system